MRLHSPVFEKALRKQVKKTVRSSRELKREFRQANRFRKHYNVGRFFRPVVGWMLGLLVWSVAKTTGHVATGLAVINLWMFGAMFFQSQRLRMQLYSSMDLHALNLLPIPRERSFRWQLQKCLRSSFFALGDVCLAFGALACFCDFPPLKWAATLLVAALSWMTLMATAAFCAVRLPKWPFQIISISMILICAVIFFGRLTLGSIAIKLLDQSAPALNLLLPTGWPASLFQLLPSDHQWWTLLLLFPVMAIIWTTRDSLKQLLVSFGYREFIMAAPSDLVPGAEAATKPSPDTPSQLGPTAIEEIIRSRRFLGLPLWPQRGWLEQRLWRWLGQREKTLSEFAYPNGFTITTAWYGIFRNLLMTAAIAFAAEFMSSAYKFGVLGLGLFITTCQTLAQIFSHGRAFQPMWLSGVSIPMYAGFGIGFQELSRLLFKCSIIQIPLLLAFTLVAGVMTALLAGFPIASGLTFGLKFGCLLFASRFIFVSLAFSSGTNDTSRLNFRTVILVVLIIVLALLFLGLGGASLFVPDQLTAWILCASAALVAYAFFWIYKWFYHSGRFDLMSLPRR